MGRTAVLEYVYLLVDCTCTHEATVSRRACFASLASIFKPVLTFWLSDLRCRLKGNLSGPMKTGIGPGGPHTMAVSYDYISGRVHVRRIYLLIAINKLLINY